MNKNLKQDFEGTQENMCESARLGINMYNADQPLFFKINGKYTKTWGTDFEKEIAEALNLPNVGTRRAIPTDKRNKAIPYAQAGIVCWLTLSGLINNIAPEAEAPALLLIAGGSDYDQACKFKWSKVKALLKAGSEFIAGNEDWLVNNGQGMDQSFPGEYNAAMEAYNKASATFYDAKQDLPNGTENKVEALNNVHAKLNAMLADGRRIHRFNKLQRDKYHYSRLLKIAQGHGKAGVLISFFDGETPIRVNTSTAIFIPGGKVFPAEADGIMRCNLAAGNYDCTITTPGYETINMKITVRPGVMGRKKVELRKVGEIAIAV